MELDWCSYVLFGFRVNVAMYQELRDGGVGFEMFRSISALYSMSIE